MNFIWLLFAENAIVSSLIFLCLIFKSKIRSAFLYRDNLAIIVGASIITYLIFITVLRYNRTLAMATSPVIVISFIMGLTLFRFYRNPIRQCNASNKDILAPADGFVTYIKRIEGDKIPISIKGKDISRLSELSKVDILNTPCWLIGITMTLFDVHYVRAPIGGQVVFNQHTSGKFLSLKSPDSVVENERNTSVIQDKRLQIGVIQIASKRVRGIRSFIQRGQSVQVGQRIGMIAFGSQTDTILPITAVLQVKSGEWVYGGKTIIASSQGS